MKVIDIISNNTLNEAGLIATGAEWLGKAAGAAYKGAKGIIDSRGLVDALSQHPGFMKKILKGKPPSVAEVESVFGKSAGEVLRKDDKIFSKALKKYYSAEKAAGKAATTATADAGTKAAGKVASTAGSITKGLNVIWGLQVAYMIGESVLECWAAISEAEDKLKRKEITPELYESYRASWISHTVTKIATSGAIALVIKGAASPLIAGSKAVHPSIGWIANTIKQLGQSWWMYYSQTPEGSKNLSSWLLGTSMIGLAAQGIITNAYDLTLGRFTKMTDASAQNIQTATRGAAQQGQGANPSQSAKNDAAATSTPPVAGTDMTNKTDPHKDRFYDLMKGADEEAKRLAAQR